MNRTALLLVLLAVVTLGIVLVAPAGGPVQVSYVDADSMAPTLEPGDAYLLVPPGDVATGDIVTFWAPSRGEFVTHRVVGETEDGYLTKGDANERTDQATGSMPVPREAVVGAVWTVAGEPVVVPAAGTVLPTLTRFQPLLLGLVLLAATALVSRSWTAGTSDRPGRSVYRIRDVVRPLFVVAVLTSLAVTPLGADAYRLTYTVGEAGSGEPVTVGESTSRDLSLDVGDSPLVTFVVTGEGLAVDRVEPTGRQLDVRVTIPPPERPGIEQAVLRVYPYPAVFPRGWLVWLHGVHPIAAVLGTTAAVFAPLYLGYRLLVDGSKPVPWLGDRSLRRYGR